MSQALPTIVLVPGAWHTPQCFDALRKILESHGFPTDKLINKDGKSVVLIGHSYGGSVISNASEGFSQVMRAQQGKEGGISLLIYLSGFVIPKGKTLFEALGGEWQPWMKFEDEYSYSSDEANVFYHDLEPEKQREWVSRLRHGSKASYLTPVTNEPWHSMRCAYIFCDEDHALPLFVQDILVSMMKNPAVGSILTAHLPASHSPFLSMPERTAETIERLIAEAGK